MNDTDMKRLNLSLILGAEDGGFDMPIDSEVVYRWRRYMTGTRTQPPEGGYAEVYGIYLMINGQKIDYMTQASGEMREWIEEQIAEVEHD